ncbi:MAG: TIGR00268 family protein [Deltaproteobacteria bacterium CG11_big_fil_rev_8_21_14_0_20_49_13]|nr:MAG: TIGR00268 family protein [Deltaproteobacteria bacterium CG11_big_fil_rev_8_21_14_0_20_49_13]
MHAPKEDAGLALGFVGETLIMISDKMKELCARIRSLGSAVVAFSGGVDSAVLAKIAHEELGNNMAAVTGESASVPSRDIASAKDFCKKHGIPHVIVRTCEFDDPLYKSNPENRCFYCKGELFETLAVTAKEKGLKYVIEGTNSSELKGHRPGFEAAKVNPIVTTPFADACITKEEVREIARALGLDLAERPSTACLSSRVPTGTALTEELLKRIDDAENFLLSIGVRQIRLRHHGDLARIESDEEGLKLCIEKKDDIVKKINGLGWKNVTLDLKGYRTGGGM